MTTHPKSLVVLLAEDQKRDLRVLRRAFERLPRVERLMVVPNGEEAMAYLRGEATYTDRKAYPFPDVLVIEECMDGISGSEVLRGLRASRKFASLPVVNISAGLPAEQAEQVARLKGACYIKDGESEQAAQRLDAAISSALDLAKTNLDGDQRGPLKINTFERPKPKCDEIRVWT
jgi:CheY-like chemotaxis protein